jgi:hypothetical protein
VRTKEQERDDRWRVTRDLLLKRGRNRDLRDAVKKAGMPIEIASHSIETGGTDNLVFTKRGLERKVSRAGASHKFFFRRVGPAWIPFVMRKLKEKDWSNSVTPAQIEKAEREWVEAVKKAQQIEIGGGSESNGPE